jgi:hypothetical protein
MMQSEFVVSLKDLRYVEVHCAHCTTKLTLDMEQPPEFYKKHGAFVPKECPGCRKSYDSAMQHGVDHFLEAYQALLAIPASVTFRGGVSSHEEI